MTAMMTARVDEHFANEDANGDGVISADEFGETRRARHEGHRERRQEFMQKFDTDGDGQLSDAERQAARDAGFGKDRPRTRR